MTPRQFSAYRKGAHAAKRQGKRASNPYGWNNNDLMHYWFAGFNDYLADAEGTEKLLTDKESEDDDDHCI